MSELVLLRNLSQWTGIPMEMIAELPASAFDEFYDAVLAKDKWLIVECDR